MPSFVFCSIAAVAAVSTGATSFAACWQPESVHAAEVRDFDTMLMVGALRCRADPDSYLERYNAFVTASRGALAEANQGLRNHFEDAVGNVAALAEYDRYIVKVANRYGAGSDDLNCRDLGSLVDAAMAEGASFSTLVAFAELAAADPLLDDERCVVEIADAAPREAAHEQTIMAALADPSI
ncbi:MAG: hypothetical protein ACKVOP_08515 [Sphingomonadaceae bacterium]